MRKRPPVHVIVYSPNTEEGRRELERKTAAVHADAVGGQLRRLDCPAEQKLRLLDAVIKTVSGNKAGGRTK